MMPALEPGRVYRTAELACWSANPTRLAGRLVEEGALIRLRHGLFAAPRMTRFGVVPPSDEALLDAFLEGEPWIRSGPDVWNALGLGSTALHVVQLVYNTKRSGLFELGGRRFHLRRVRFPEAPTPEWYVVDLLTHADAAGVSRAEVVEDLRRWVEAGRYDAAVLVSMAEAFATREVQGWIARAVS